MLACSDLAWATGVVDAFANTTESEASRPRPCFWREVTHDATHRLERHAQRLRAAREGDRGEPQRRDAPLPEQPARQGRDRRAGGVRRPGCECHKLRAAHPRRGAALNRPQRLHLRGGGRLVSRRPAAEGAAVREHPDHHEERGPFRPARSAPNGACRAGQGVRSRVLQRLGHGRHHRRRARGVRVDGHHLPDAQLRSAVGRRLRVRGYAAGHVRVRGARPIPAQRRERGHVVLSECRAARPEREVRTCPWCGREFVPVRDAAWCSRRCREHGMRHQRTAIVGLIARTERLERRMREAV